MVYLINIAVTLVILLAYDYFRVYKVARMLDGLGNYVTNKEAIAQVREEQTAKEIKNVTDLLRRIV